MRPRVRWHFDAQARLSQRIRTSTVIVVFTLNIVFNHWTWRRNGSESAVEVAVREGAVAVNVPDDGVRSGG